MKTSILYFILFIPCLAASLLSNASDRLPLLAFKSAISSDPFHSLASWNDTVSHCQWPGVMCSQRHAGRVTTLELDSLNLVSSIPPSLSNLTFLRRLSLADNQLHGRIPSELGSLVRLQYLNLSMNSLEGEIPYSLSLLFNIQTIALDGNKLQGSVPANLSRCLHLKMLTVSNNQLTGEIPSQLASLRSLLYLNLGTNNLVGSIPPSLSNLSTLVALDLSNNSVSGSIPSSFGQLKSLVFFYLNNNRLVGSIPHSIANLSSLSRINLSYNNLTGGLPSLFGNLSELAKIDVTMNMLSGPIPAQLGNLHALYSLSLTGNAFSGSIPSSLGLLPSLVGLSLSHNQLSGTVPPTIYNSSTLEHLGLAGNQLVGNLPRDFGQSLPALQSLLLYYNQFDGSLPMSLANASTLSDIELTGNSFSGKIPASLGNLVNLVWLDLDRNEFDARGVGGWDFLSSLTNCTKLQALSLDYNGVKGLGGVLPKSVANLSTELNWLALGGNQISGIIPAEIQNLASLSVLGMDRNLLSGSIPTTIGKLQNLQELFLSKNSFSGTIPASIGNLTQLNKLDISDNALEGNIPLTLGDCQALRWLNLSDNQLTGTIPKEVVSISSLTEFLDLSHNSLNGSLPSEVGRLRNLVQFYVSGNNLSGEIPGSLGDCQLLNMLYMDDNRFQGIIPSSMSNLKGIQGLDLSRNNLSGPIPKFLEGFRFLQNVNLSFNNFEGELPRKGVFRNSSAVSIIGNNGLCGGEPEFKLPMCPSRNNERRNGSQMLTVIIVVSVVSLCSVLLVCFLIVWYWLRHRGTNASPSSEPMEEGQIIKVSYSEILRATDGLSAANLIGAGSFGRVYKGIMNFGEEKTVAIKVLNLQQKGASKSFMAECDALKSIRHRNLVKILTLCSSTDFEGNDFKALVFEYMPNGNLDSWLHPEEAEDERRYLNLELRLSIAIDVAFALDYLHHYGPEPVIHCDLKPSNVLLDNDMTAHVADFGLAKILSKTIIGKASQASTGSIGMKGTIGYVAPEYGVANRVSIQGDVYSYGVLLLEMFTGRRPTDETLREGLNLHKLVEMAIPEHIMDAADPALLFQCEDRNSRLKAQECLVSVLRIGLSCSKQLPMERMQMWKAIREMQTIKEKFTGIRNNIDIQTKGEGSSDRSVHGYQVKNANSDETLYD